MYKRFWVLNFMVAGYNSAYGMQHLKTMTAIVMAKVRATPRVIQEKVLTPVGHGVQRAAVATKGATYVLGQFAGEQLGCVRRRKTLQSKKED